MTREREIFFNRVVAGERITTEEAVWAYDNMPLYELSQLAIAVKKSKSGDDIFYNKNFHIEPTNICLYNCKFCSYRKREGENGARNMSIDDIINYTKQHLKPTTTEIHLVGGVNPSHSLEHYINVIKAVKSVTGEGVAIKAFSAVEHIYIIDKAGLTFEEGISALIDAGMDTFTGGGAEIFDEGVRGEICPDKASSERWLMFHEAAHRLGITSNATMLYGHIENISHRVDHLNRLRELQDRTGGFTTFIPLKYRSKNNSMGSNGETSIIDDMKTLAISRIFLDNFDHIKAYPPMFGSERTEQAMLFGADDIDGTVNDTTDIYSTAGVAPTGMSESDMQQMIRRAGFTPVERDTFYWRIK